MTMSTSDALMAPKTPAVRAFPARPRTSWASRANIAALTLIAVLGVNSALRLHINPATFIAGYDNAVHFLSRTVPLRFPAPAELWDMVAQTLAIVVLATLLGFVLSVPVALLAAHTTTPHPAIRMLTRAYIVTQRAVPEFVIAIFFVRAFGFGSIPGILGLGLGIVGMMGKLFTDAIEEQDPGPREALRAAGATSMQQIAGSVIPMLRPAMVATTLHAFDINLRSSVLLGFIGVGGIGLYISTYLDTMNYRSGLGLTVVLLLLCLVAELVSARIRRVLLGEGQRTSRRRRSLVRRRPPATAAVPSAPVEPARVRRPWDASRLRRLGWVVGAVTIVVLSVLGAGISWSEVPDGVRQLWPTAELYLPPSDGGIPDKLLGSLGETIEMGLAGTLLGLIVAIPFGLLSARNVAPAPWIANTARALVVAIRSIPAIIVGICFVVITGLGATAGALALAVASIGFFGKIIADSLEETDVRVQEALRAGGARDGQVFLAATLRQVLPALASHTLHQTDACIRGATGLGIIGAGGIGFYITNASRVLEYGVVTTCTLLVVAVVLVVEALALWTRRCLR